MNTFTPPIGTVHDDNAATETEIKRRQYMARRRKPLPVQYITPVVVGFEEAAKILCMSSRTVKRLDATGQFPGAFGGKGCGPGRGRRLIPVRDIEDYIRRGGARLL